MSFLKGLFLQIATFLQVSFVCWKVTAEELVQVSTAANLLCCYGYIKTIYVLYIKYIYMVFFGFFEYWDKNEEPYKFQVGMFLSH